eukprot:3734835-Prymnesium_polylepis.1
MTSAAGACAGSHYEAIEYTAKLLLPQVWWSCRGRYENGVLYEGEFQNGQKHGRGTKRYAMATRTSACRVPSCSGRGVAGSRIVTSTRATSRMTMTNRDSAPPRPAL